MIRLVRSELLKLRTTPGPWVILALAVPLTVLSMLNAFLHLDAATGRPGLRAAVSTNDLRLLLGSGYRYGVVLAPLIGVLCVTAEYRYQVLTTTLLVTPRRSRILVSKSLACAIWSVLLGIVGLAAVAVVGLPWQAGLGGSVSAVLGQSGAVLPGYFAVLVLFSLFGLGFGTLVKNQIAAVLVTIFGTVVIEPVIVALVQNLEHVSLNWLPSEAAASLAGVISLGTSARASNYALLAWWAGGLVLAAWSLGTLVLGALITLRRDVT